MDRAFVESAPREFGSVISTHGLRREYRTLGVSLTVIGLCTAFLSAAIGIYRWYFAYRHFGPAAVARWSGPALGISLASAMLGLIGLAYFERIPWDQIQAISTSSVRYGLPWFSWGRSSKITIHLKPKGKRSLSQSLTNLDQLAITAKKYVYPGLLEQYRQALQQGDAVQFGSIEITRRELLHGKRKYPWAEINKVKLDRGFLIIEKQSAHWKRRMRLSAQRIPNIDLCFQLIQHFLTEEKTRHQGA